MPLGELAPDEPRSRRSATAWAGSSTFCSPFDVTGQPAISLPLHWNDDGLPIGVQLVAAYGREDVLLRVAAQLEAGAAVGRSAPADPRLTERGRRYLLMMAPRPAIITTKPISR